jgi:hypothetical protein
MTRDPDALDAPAPEVNDRLKRCSRCEVDAYLLIFIPAGAHGRGIRLCQGCLAHFDQLRGAPAVAAGG